MYRRRVGDIAVVDFGTAQHFEVGARVEAMADVVRNRADIGAGGTADREICFWWSVTREREFVHRYFDRQPFNYFSLAREFI